MVKVSKHTRHPPGMNLPSFGTGEGHAGPLLAWKRVLECLHGPYLTVV